MRLTRRWRRCSTGVTLWRGERIDWPLAVGHLFDKQGL